jgi:hypothetical protein
MIFKPASLVFIFLLLLPLGLHLQAAAQTGVLRGEVVDPSGAVVPKAQVTVSHGARVRATQTRDDGRFVFYTLAPGSYALKITANGFAPLRVQGISVANGMVKELNLPLVIAALREEVTVEGHAQNVGISPDQNSSSLVFRGKDLNALSDDPNELQAELQQLAGAAAGPNGGQIYVDGFAGGQLPPKSSILEIRVNQNPFSSEFDRIGYGRVEIITKPGSEKFHGSLSGYGNTSGTNSANPLVSDQPAYYMYSYSGDIGGPLGKNASFLLSGFRLDKQNQNMVDAVNPQNPAAKTTQAVANPGNILVANPRIDVQAGKHMLSFRDYFYRSNQSGAGVGALDLPKQAISMTDQENTLQFADTDVVNASLLNQLHLQWRHVRYRQTPDYFTPAVIVSGAFSDGGNSAGTVRDHQDIFELQNFVTATTGNHTLRFGVQLRLDRDTNFSTAGSNGTYTFSSLAAYQAGQPSQYYAAVINNPVAHAYVVDGAGFFQDDWRWKPNLMLGLGLRWEGQNWIHDHSNWAPRLALAWSPGRPSSTAAKTVIRAGYGWFYERFTVPSAFSSYAGSPYVMQAIHDDRKNQQSYVVNNPNFFDPAAPVPSSVITSSPAAVPSFHTIDSHFHAAQDMQVGVGVDQQFNRAVTANITYLYTQGVHQYLSSNVTAPNFDAITYNVTGPAPAVYNYQFQSGGVFRQNQFIFNGNIQTSHFVLTGSYTLNQARSDTQGVYSFVSDARNPGLDYGRASFGVRHRATILESYTAPFGIVIASLFTVQSGVPFNLTTGSDLTGNNQFNARPAYGTCGSPGIISTHYGCLDPNPVGKGERMVPFGAGTGPSNLLFDMRLSKVFGVGPRTKTEAVGSTLDSNSIGDRGIGSGGAAIRMNASAPRRYNLTFIVGASNLFNFVNLGTPNGVLNSPIFNQSQSLAGGAFANPTPGNRAFIFQTNFSF